jgi:osmotically-inducible protein OsmY
MFGATDDHTLFESLLESHGSSAYDDLLAVPFREGAISISDAALTGAIGQSLRATGYPALRNVEIGVSEGEVVLTGRVPSYHLKQLAQATAQQFLQVRGITNSIEVVNGR